MRKGRRIQINFNLNSASLRSWRVFENRKQNADSSDGMVDEDFKNAISENPPNQRHLRSIKSFPTFASRERGIQPKPRFHCR